MDLKRFWRHILMSPSQAARAFPAATLDAIGREVTAHEQAHRGEVAFIVEAELTTAQLWAGVTPRARAKELFALRGIWNTQENNGVLVYVLLADRDVEIVADRGIDALVTTEQWEAIAHTMEGHFREHRFEAGARAGVAAVSELLQRHFPALGEARNEIEDRPSLI